MAFKRQRKKIAQRQLKDVSVAELADPRPLSKFGAKCLSNRLFSAQN